MAATAGSGSPCGACKFLRRKCTTHCIFAPYFCTEQDPARFAAIHKVFGASNVAKLLQHLAVPDRCDAVVSIAYEAQARIKDPVYGCVAHIFALQQQVACLQAQLMQVRAQMAQKYSTLESQQTANYMTGSMISYQNYINVPNFNTSSRSLIDHSNEGTTSHTIQSRNYHYDDGDDDDALFKRVSESDLGELQELAVRMMRN